MILWISGNTGAGKTTLAKALMRGAERTIHLDGDDCRASINRGLGLSEEGRRENCLRIARLAKMLSGQGFSIIVSVIAPYRDLRQEIQEICDCQFVYLLKRGAEATKETPYEAPTHSGLYYTIFI